MSTYRAGDASWRPVSGSPFAFRVEAGPASANASYLAAPEGGLSATAGDAVAIPVTVLDVYGNARAPAPGELAVSFVSSPDGGIAGSGIISTDEHGRTFATTAALTRADRTHLVEARLTLDGSALVPGSGSFALVTLAGAPHPPASTVSGSGVVGGVAGDSREVVVDVRDRYGNPIVDAGAVHGVAATLTVRLRVPANATRDNDGDTSKRTIRRWRASR